jgi:hypothetical protein
MKCTVDVLIRFVAGCEAHEDHTPVRVFTEQKGEPYHADVIACDQCDAVFILLVPPGDDNV